MGSAIDSQCPYFRFPYSRLQVSICMFLSFKEIGKKKLETSRCLKLVIRIRMSCCKYLIKSCAAELDLARRMSGLPEARLDKRWESPSLGQDCPGRRTAFQ